MTPAMAGAIHARERLAEAAEQMAAARPDAEGLARDDADYLRAFRETCLAMAGRLRAMDAPSEPRRDVLRGVSGRGR